MHQVSSDSLFDVGLPPPFGTLGPALGGIWADLPEPAQPREEVLPPGSITADLRDLPAHPSGPLPYGSMGAYAQQMLAAGQAYGAASPYMYPGAGGYGPMQRGWPTAGAGVVAPLDPIEQVTGFLNSWGTPPALPGFTWNWTRRLYDVDVGAVHRDPGAVPLAVQALRLGTEWTYLQPYRPAEGQPWRYRWIETASPAPVAGGVPYIVRGEVGGPLAPRTVVGIRATQPVVETGLVQYLGSQVHLGAAAPTTPFDMSAPAPLPSPAGAGSGLPSGFLQPQLGTMLPTGGGVDTYRSLQAHREQLAAQIGTPLGVS